MNNIAIILVEPKGSGNIGSIARAMMNFGFSDLRLVNPRVDHLNKEATDMAVSAKKSLLKNCQLFGSLAEALADCKIAIGSTRRLGKYRDHWIKPDNIKNYCSPTKKVGLVFGREDHGLTTDELSMCQYFISIATDPTLPSMNLAQAVTICLYELSKNRLTITDNYSKEIESASIADLEGMYAHILKALDKAKFLDAQNPNHLLKTFRKIFGRTTLEKREVRIIHGVFSRIEWLASNCKKKL